MAGERSADISNCLCLFELNHPANPGHPPKVFAREYGPLCTAQGNYFTGPSTLGAGQQMRMRHRLVVHRGDAARAGIAEQYTRYCQEDQ